MSINVLVFRTKGYLVVLALLNELISKKSMAFQICSGDGVEKMMIFTQGNFTLTFLPLEDNFSGGLSTNYCKCSDGGFL